MNINYEIRGMDLISLPGNCSKIVKLSDDASIILVFTEASYLGIFQFFKSESLNRGEIVLQ